MFVRLKKHRRFDYTPRFYKPDRRSEERKPIRFRRSRKKSGSRSLLFFAIVIAILAYVLHLLTQF